MSFEFSYVTLLHDMTLAVENLLYGALHFSVTGLYIAYCYYF